MIIRRISPFTNKENTMDLNVTTEEIKRWQGGELIQNVWPNLTPSEREFLKTGITDEEWNNTFGNEE